MRALPIFLVLISYPALVMFVLEPVTSKWGKKYRGTLPLPNNLRTIAARNARYLLAFDMLLTITLVRFMSHEYREVAAQWLAQGQSWVFHVVVGIALGLILGVLRYMVSKWRDAYGSRSFVPDYATGPIMIWIPIFFLGGYAEESWRAFCLLAMASAYWSVPTAVFATSLAFGFAYMSCFVNRIAGTGSDLLITMVWGASLAALFLAFGSLLSPVIANVVCNLSNMMLRRRQLPLY